MQDLRWSVGEPYGDGPLMVACPSVEHDDDTASCAVYYDHAYCFGCRRYWGQHQWLKEVDKLGDVLPEYDGTGAARDRELRLGRGQGTRGDLGLLVGVWVDTLLHPHSPRRHRIGWLLNRGLRYTTIKRARIGHTGTHFSIPIFTADWQHCCGAKFRRDDAHCDPLEPKYTQPRGQRNMLYQPFPRAGPKVICEGELDALLVGQYGFDALTCTSGAGALADTFRGWRFRRPVFVAVDQDDAGEESYTELVRSVAPSSVPMLHRVQWNGAKDISDYVIQFPEVRRREELCRLLR